MRSQSQGWAGKKKERRQGQTAAGGRTARLKVDWLNQELRGRSLLGDAPAATSSGVGKLYDWWGHDGF